MFLDLHEVPEGDTLAADICVVGAGAAGITLALELEGAGFDVLVLESGGFEFDGDVQDLYGGETVNPAFAPLDVTRLRYFGGSTNHWNGRSMPLTATDFEARPWIPDSGWPFDLDHLRPYYERAQPILELPPYAYRAEDWTGADWPALPLESDVITTEIVHRSPPTRMGEVYRNSLEQARDVRVCLHANAIGFELDDDVRSVRALDVASLDGRRRRVTANRFVLAMGGIEIPRLLLQPRPDLRGGLGNEHGLVGRYFSDHVNCPAIGRILFTDPQPGLAHFRPWSRDGFQRALGLSAETQAREELLNADFSLYEYDPRTDSAGVRSFQSITGDVRARRWPDGLLGHLGRVIGDIGDVTSYTYDHLRGTGARIADLHYSSELPPHADSRIELTSERDALGLQRVRLDWKIPEQFYSSFARPRELLAQEIGRQELGRVQFDEERLADLASHYHNSHHHMGTTRMHDDPKLGVVDRDARMHVIANLYVASSSVFPAYGHANPTLTIVALAIRLADHLKNARG